MPLPRVHLSHDSAFDWLTALEFGRIHDGTPREDWEGVDDDFGFLHSGVGGPIMGFMVKRFSRFDVDDPSYVCDSQDPYRASYLGSVSGFPEITVPAGRVSANMPVGLSFLGAPYSEESLLALAAAFEAANPARAAPDLR